MSLFHRPLCAIFGGHDFKVIGGKVVCMYCGYCVKSGKRRGGGGQS